MAFLFLWDSTTPISSYLSIDPLLIGKTAPDAANASGNAPKAYLTVLFFDERFKFVEEGSNSIRVSQADAANAILPLANLKAPKNGYVYIYVSNESSEYVYFDNLQVSFTRGRIIEENHYYAFGLKIAGISSVKLPDANEGNINNKNLYNDKELIDEADLNWYDLGYRNYDPQTGRFLQIDPLTDHFPDYSPYLFAGNDPIASIDLDGLAPIPGLNGTFANLGEVIVKAAPRVAQTAKTGLTALKVANIAVKAADIATDFIPLVSGGKDIYRGIQSGNGWQVALGVGSIALDIFTFGGSSVAKGVVKTAVREGAEMLVKEEAEQVIKQVAKKNAVVIGENMDRVQKFANKNNMDYWKGWDNTLSAEQNLNKNIKAVEKWKSEGREIVDIGPHFGRRAAGVKPRKAYNAERKVVKKYDNYKKVFKRTGKTSGGVEGLD